MRGPLPAEEPLMFKHILLATDDSPAARRAERAGVELAARLGARLRVLRVLAPEPAVSLVADVIQGEMPALRAIVRANEHLGGVLAAATAAGVTCETEHVFDNRPYAAIAGAATKYGCDLVVMGAHAGGGLSELLQGDSTRKVILNCDVSVLVCR
jgi:nucleotide-binding universal stress UspA family protein